MICLWHSDTGVPYNQRVEGNEELERKMVETIAQQTIALLSPGVYSLTSGFAHGMFLQHKLVVRYDGKGLVSTLPIRLREIQSENEPLFVPSYIGKREEIVLPDQRLFMMIAIPDDEDPEVIRIVDFVFHRPSEDPAFLRGMPAFSRSPFSVN